MLRAYSNYISIRKVADSGTGELTGQREIGEEEGSISEEKREANSDHDEE